MKRLVIIACTSCVGVALACGPFFYPAPPTLDAYPERLPAKTMRELLRETTQQPPHPATFEQLAAETRAIGAELATVPREKLIERIDAALARNRAGDYRKRFANALFDFRDVLVAGEFPPAEAAAYAQWRLEAMQRRRLFRPRTGRALGCHARTACCTARSVAREGRARHGADRG